MIIVQIKEGLGNQLFQYAAGRQLAFRLGAELKLDISWFASQNSKLAQREYYLDKLNIEAQTASDRDIVCLKPAAQGKLSRKIKRFQARKFRAKKQSYFIERSRNYDGSFYRITDNSYIEGYFQSEKYFKEIRIRILGEIEPRQTVLQQSTINPQELSVSLHIRRGDYLELSKYPVIPLIYYQRALELLKHKIEKFRLYIFSDDPLWTEENLKPDIPYTLIKGNDPVTDLFILKSCNHHIIANSSFSWWGAWLGTTVDKIVIAPKLWRLKGKMKKDDRYPKGWIML